MWGKVILLATGSLVGAAFGFRYQEQWVADQRDIAREVEAAAYRGAVQAELQRRKRMAATSTNDGCLLTTSSA